ncbi:insulinase family protein [Thiotrichales bacterium 19S3-7]|nr:insulinase family protein [Thiotrichales bacterium 19S3-7]MCF6801267.1 insulinase family protein [Thiotrichales bacterium 19S3-11]
MTFKSTLSSALTLSLLTMSSSYAESAKEISLPESNPIYEYTLDNGLKIIIKPDHRAPVVLSQIWYRVGSTYEPNGITGISHMLEHMMFKGTKQFKPGDIDQLVEENGGQQNAFTSYDYTAYYQYWGKDNLKLSFEIESDRMHQLQLEQHLFDKEKQVVLEERNMRTEDNPIGYAFERHMAAANLSNPRHHPIIGWRGDIEQYQLDDLNQWYKQWYAPNNATLVVVGDVDPKAVYEEAKHYFNAIPKATLPIQKVHYVQPASGIQRVDVKRPKVEVPTIIIGYNTPSIKTAENAWEPYALMVLDSILGGNASSRLQTNLIRKKEVATSISSEYEPFAINGTQLIVFALPTPNFTLELLEKGIIAQIESLKHDLISETELQRVKVNVLASKVYSMDSLNSQAYLLGSFASIGLSPEQAQEYLKYLLEVTPEQIQQVANKYLVEDNMTITYLRQKESS